MQVSFTHQLDMFEFCSKDLQAKLLGPRKAYGEIADAKAGVKKDKPAPAEDAADGALTSLCVWCDALFYANPNKQMPQTIS